MPGVHVPKSGDRKRRKHSKLTRSVAAFVWTSLLDGMLPDLLLTTSWFHGILGYMRITTEEIGSAARQWFKVHPKGDHFTVGVVSCIEAPPMFIVTVDADSAISRAEGSASQVELKRSLSIAYPDVQINVLIASHFLGG